MKANELRIGNFVNHQGRAQKIHSLNMSNVRVSELSFNDYNSTISNEIIKPIPLTEEWVLKLGFEENETNWCHYSLEYEPYSFIDISFDDELPTINIRGIDNDVNYFNFEYVHEIQNLHFLLTQRELKI